MFKFVGILFCAALPFFLAGCASTPDAGVPAPPDWTTNGVVDKPVPSLYSMPVPGMPRTNAVSLPQTNWPPVSFRTNIPPATNIFKPAPVLTWTSLDRWAAENKIGAVRRMSNGPTTRYFIDCKKGLLILEIGSTEAIWRGMQFHLGFAPEIIDNQVFIHGLDLQKNLVPLLLGEPLAFGTNRVIVIDPGHGGINGGTISVLDNRPEKDFTLDWARRVKPLLESNGWTVFLTRSNDIYMTNASRVVFAETHHAAVFLSLHFNSAAPDPKPAGLETYCFTPTGMPSTVTRGYADPRLEKISSNDFDTQNLLLAVRLQSTLQRVTQLEDRGVRRVRYMEVLRNQKCPACLIEGGYLSNPREAEKIESGAFRQKLAEAVAEALK